MITHVSVTEYGPKHGMPLVWLHGFSVSTAAYTEMLEDLADRGYHVFGIDLPSHGGSDDLPPGSTMSTIVDSINAAVSSIRGPMVIAGHSFGGWVAAEYAATYPEQVERLILVDAAVGVEFHERTKCNGRFSAFAWRMANMLCHVVMDATIDAINAASVRTWFERMRLVGMMRGSSSGARCLKLIPLLVDAESDSTLKSLQTIDTYFLHGCSDHIVPWEAALSAAILSRSELIWLPGKAHSWLVAEPKLAGEMFDDIIKGAA